MGDLSSTLEDRLREVEILLATHKEALRSIPDIASAVIDLRVGMERLNTTIKMAGGLVGLLIAAIEVVHQMVR
jgi:hypothetical protein